jgi:2,5-diketo-D-gluconate reductase B
LTPVVSRALSPAGIHLPKGNAGCNPPRADIFQNPLPVIECRHGVPAPLKWPARREEPCGVTDDGLTHVVEANGARIPLLGLGTWELRGRTCARITEQALRLGYRHIDTAQMYGNEREVGEGLRASGVKRDDVFVTTKIWPSHFAPHDFDRAAKERLVQLRLSDVDLLLLHWPSQQVPLAETLGALCKVKRSGMARHIGVSNFTVALLKEANRLSSEPLVCNQFELHPFLDQAKVIAATRRYAMAVIAYSPIARAAAKTDPVLTRIGHAHGKSGTQVALRYLVQQDIAVIPRTSRIERLSENCAIFDFALSEAEIAEIAGLARKDGRIVDFSGSPAWD